MTQVNANPARLSSYLLDTTLERDATDVQAPRRRGIHSGLSASGRERSVSLLAPNFTPRRCVSFTPARVRSEIRLFSCSALRGVPDSPDFDGLLIDPADGNIGHGGKQDMRRFLQGADFLVQLAHGRLPVARVMVLQVIADPCMSLL
jgi:hypothetical protein